MLAWRAIYAVPSFDIAFRVATRWRPMGKSNSMTTIGKIFNSITRLLAFIASVILVSMMLLTVVKVIMRSVFNYGMLGVDQITGTMMVYLTFLGAAWVLRQEGHVSVDLLTAAVPARVERGLNVVGSIIAAAVCFTMTYFSFTTVMLSLQRGVMVAAELEIPRAVNLAVIPLGCALLGIEFIRRARRYYLGTVEYIPVELREH